MCDTAMSDSVSGVEMVGVVIWATLLAVFVGTEADCTRGSEGIALHCVKLHTEQGLAVRVPSRTR